MGARAIVDTGFLVALGDSSDEYHEWALSLVSRIRGPWLTAEACLSETIFLYQGAPAARAGVEQLFALISRGMVESQHLLPEELEPVQHELTRYKDRWVDFADACIVRLSDLRPQLPVITTDARDFAVYFRQRAGRTLLLPSAKAKRVKKPRRA